MYQNLLFDLDGTLTDPGIGITNSVSYALEKYGIKTKDRSQLYPFIGPPLQDSFEEFYGFSKEDAGMAVKYYREYYEDRGILENRIYDGIPQLLQSLCDAGMRLFVATSKPECFAVQILEYFSIQQYFTYIAGSGLDGSRSGKDEVIAYALKAGNIQDPASAVMIGDRRYDIAGAKKNGLASIGVLFGYGSRRELEEAGADFIVSCPEDIYPLILQPSEVPANELYSQKI